MPIGSPEVRPLLSGGAVSLEKYTGARLVVQHANTRLYDAVRAMEENHVGCVLVQDDAQIGIVTDRDIALELVVFDLDPFDATLQDLLSTPASILPVTASVEDAATLMLERHVRRIPIVDRERRLAGIITLDDLILDQAVDAATLAAIVRAQLSEPSRLKRRGQVRPTRSVDDEARLELRSRRHAARARASYDVLIERTLGATGLEIPEGAIVALQTVLCAITHRLRAEEAEDLLAQLPSLLRDRIADPGSAQDRSVTLRSIAEALAARLNVDATRGEEIVRQVGAVLSRSISPGQIANVRAQLPAELKAILQAPAREA